jgi:glycerophosphoryl diester phosphodiesterase
MHLISRKNTPVCLFMSALVLGCGGNTDEPSANTPAPIPTATAYCLRVPQGKILDFFSASGLNFPVASAVRGGVFDQGTPEMSIASFQKSIQIAPTLIEVKPNLSQDGTLFLLSDKTLERTTTGTGAANLKTWDELKKLKLRDKQGTVTESTLPTLRETLAWAQDKTILQINMENEHLGITPGLSTKVIELIKEMNAADRVMLISWSNAQAKSMHDQAKELAVAVFSFDQKGFTEAVNLGLAWPNIVPTFAFDVDKNLVKFLNEKNRSIAYMTYFIETPQTANLAPTYRQLWADGIKIQATIRLQDFANAFDWNTYTSPYLIKNCPI